MKLYSVHIDIEDDNPYQYVRSLSRAMSLRSQEMTGFGEIDKIETSPDMSNADLVLAILNEEGWVAKRTVVEPDWYLKENQHGH